MSPVNQLVVMVKAPRLGAVKSRLARDIGAVAAWTFYRRTMGAVLGPLARDGRWRSLLAVTPDRAARQPRLWPVKCVRMSQGSGDLGRRMDRVMETLPPGPVVIIGADIPAVRPHHIASAFRALGNHDAVFGPATDGGYWLVGLRRRPRVTDLFTSVRLSTPHALADTLANLAPGQSAAMVETLDDVDDGPALARWLADSEKTTPGVPSAAA